MVLPCKQGGLWVSAVIGTIQRIPSSSSIVQTGGGWGRFCTRVLAAAQWWRPLQGAKPTQPIPIPARPPGRHPRLHLFSLSTSLSLSGPPPSTRQCFVIKVGYFFPKEKNRRWLGEVLHQDACGSTSQRHSGAGRSKKLNHSAQYLPFTCLTC